MRLKMLSALTLFALFLTQTVAAVGEVLLLPATPGQQASPSSGTLTLPAGKVIPLTLVSPIRSKSSKVGDTIRAQIAFPITVASQIAIPAGTYVEGTLQSVNARKTQSRAGGVQIHFTRLIFANGYTVALDAVNQAAVDTNDLWQRNAGAGAGLGVGLAWLPVPLPAPFAGGQTAPPAPTLPPLPGPPKAFLISASIIGAAFVAFLVYLFTASHRASNSDYVLYDAGYQFQMVTTTAVTIDAAQASAAAAVAPQ